MMLHSFPARSISIEDYASNKPFPNTRLEGVLDDNLLRNALSVWPDDGAAGWITYENPLEQKRTWNICDALGGSMLELLRELENPRFVNELSDLTGIPGLRPDPELYGGGLSVMRQGDFLKLHRDLEIHKGLERRLNLVVFLNEVWKDDWGGALELWGAGPHGEPGWCAKRIRPTFGRVVLFDPAGYHGVPDPVQCPADIERRAVQVFYYSEPRPQNGLRNPRTTAQFAGRPGGESDRLLNEWRRYSREPTSRVES